MTNVTDKTRKTNTRERENDPYINKYEANQLLQGQTVVIIGGTSGMGLGTAYAAQKAGATVIIAGRKPIAEPDHHLSAEYRFVDVTDEVSVKRLFEQTGEFDHLLITAAPAPGTWDNFLNQDVKAAQTYLNYKFWGSWAAARYAAPHIKTPGSITFLTGCAAVRPKKGMSMVTAAFAALESLSQSLALELGPLRVNTIRPGLTESPMWDFLEEHAREQVFKSTSERFPVGRVGTIYDIGNAAVFLMANSFVTGTILEISGGESLVD